MHSVLDAVGEDLKPPDSKQFVIVPRVYRRFSSPYLPVIARYGGLNDVELESTLNEVHSHRYEFDLDLSKSVRVEEVGGDGDLLGPPLRRRERSIGRRWFRKRADAAETYPARVTDHWPRQSTCSQIWSGREEGRYTLPIVVTGGDDSVEDFALFWNLRSEYHFARLFPLWIPIDLLENEQAPAAIESAIGRIRPSVMSSRKDDLLIVSASMDATELRDRLHDRYPEARIGADDLIDLFTATCEYRYTTEKLPVQYRPRPGGHPAPKARRAQ